MGGIAKQQLADYMFLDCFFLCANIFAFQLGHLMFITYRYVTNNAGLDNFT